MPRWPRLWRRRSRRVHDASIERLTSDPAFPYLVSFPRTGSHWLRMLMELTFSEPSLVRTFYHHGATSFTCYHTHDMDLDVKRESVIYLHRASIPTVYSQLRYHDHDPHSETMVRYWATRYALHRRKWLVDDDFTRRKTVVRYEEIRDDPTSALRKVAAHLDRPMRTEDAEAAAERVTKDRVASKTPHDRAVISRDEGFGGGRQAFAERWGQMIHGVDEDHGIDDHRGGPESASGPSSPDREPRREQ